MLSDAVPLVFRAPVPVTVIPYAPLKTIYTPSLLPALDPWVLGSIVKELPEPIEMAPVTYTVS
ncbi:MAG: hypothetical protein JRJ57_05735 [Deltaproteobacteria bacterium]|nr:hypothetical protein [Deltaproteobacteria bacterium]